jgi:hypothetical protein
LVRILPSADTKNPSRNPLSALWRACLFVDIGGASGLCLDEGSMENTGKESSSFSMGRLFSRAVSGDQITRVTLFRGSRKGRNGYDFNLSSPLSIAFAAIQEL